jgi:hypothetical protein
LATTPLGFFTLPQSSCYLAGQSRVTICILNYPIMRRNILLLAPAAALLIAPNLSAFVSVQERVHAPHFKSHRPASSSSFADSEQQEGDLGLTPELKRFTDAFAAIGDEQVRYKQLLYMAQNTKEANSFPEASKIPQNKVPGCLSTVYIDGTAEYNESLGDYVVNFVGDSDGLLTKGLVALLVR